MKTNIAAKLAEARAVRIHFTKKDGSKRILRGTLNKRSMPANAAEKYNGQPREDYLTVWDLENQGFRQVKLDTVKDFEVEL